MEKLIIRDYSDPDDRLSVEEDADRGTRTGAVALTCYGMGDNATVLLDRAGVLQLFNWLSVWLLANSAPCADCKALVGEPTPCIVPYGAPLLTGMLCDARWEPEHHRAPCLTGYVYGHKGFTDGTRVWTSRVLEHCKGDLFRTQSGSLYAVEWAPGNSGVWPVEVKREG